MVYGTGTDYGPGRTCDAGHPYVIPQITQEISFTIDANFAKWHPASDEMVTGMKRGATFHVDYWEGWSPTVKATWQKVCLEGHLSCSSGDLGNGTELINAGEPLASYGKHELVDLATLTSVPAPAPAPAPAPTPPPTTTKVCPDGTVIAIASTCPVTRTNKGNAVGRQR